VKPVMFSKKQWRHQNRPIPTLLVLFKTRKKNAQSTSSETGMASAYSLN